MSYHYKDFNMMYDRNLFTAAKMGDVQNVTDNLHRNPMEILDYLSARAPARRQRQIDDIRRCLEADRSQI
ncbi:Oidioi.mRNA.OKI2018_I69.chr1.g729.t1.cds [Oikopleura dioica]|uniref:Oidioi.mRNA.OKI2018_I69.chr1.g729.t1.cds n=1 Tax=Oikopleura dioica TaxID=34765 RepID=A0ABN7SMG6_OIKDI|nr:Oidioi.mRNA.OKI2018_I69.chr1.g729.t1.cds [Oikopleura dioica]